MLLHGKGPFEKRFDKFIKTVKHLDPASLTEILCLHDPERYGVWNDRSRKALQILGFDDLRRMMGYWDVADVINTHEKLSNVIESLAKLQLVKGQFK